MKKTQAVLEEVAKERRRQVRLGWTQKQDDNRNLAQWCELILSYLRQAVTYLGDPDRQRVSLIKVAALAVAAVESLDRRQLKKGQRGA